MRSKLAAAVAALLTAAMILAAPAGANGHRRDLQFLGQAIVPTGDDVRGDDGRRAVVDHLRRAARRLLRGLRRRGQLQPVRYYTVGLDVRDGRLSDGDVHFKDVTTLLAPGGVPYAPGSIDPEGLALTKDRQLIFTSEGFANSLIDPFVRRYSLDGSFLGELPVPQAVPADGRPVERRPAEPRVRERRRAAGRPLLFTATENALYQDGPAATIANGSPARILRYDLRTGRLDRQWVYETDPVAEPPVPATAVLGQRPRGAPAAQQRVPDRDGALVLRRRARHRQHDQALRGLAAAAPRRRAQEALLLDLDTSASRSTTSRA